MFRRCRPLVLAIGLLLLLLSAVGGGLVFLVKAEPAFYTSGECPTDYDTREQATRLLTRVQDLKNDIRERSDWGETFTAEELNCFFAEMMTEKGTFTSLLPTGFHSPRVAIEDDRLQLGFRYGEGFWSTIVWIELRLWLVAEETNLMAVEVCNLRAGWLPIGAQSILDAIGDTARQSNIDVTWYRSQSNPVGLFRFFPDQPHPSSQVLTLEVHEGKLAIAGRSTSVVPLDSPGP